MALRVPPQKQGRIKGVVPKSERTLYGIVFDSKKEMLRFADLKNLERAGVIRDLSAHPSFRLYAFGIGGERIEVGTYTADAAYTDVATGEAIVEDTKSIITARDPYYRMRKRLAEACHGIKVKEVK